MHTVDLDNVIVTHESGSAREYMVPFWEARQPRSFLGWGKSTQLGYSLGLAMGAKLAAPDKQVINVMGDMAFSTVGLDIETAVRCHIPILTIVLNNASMAIYDNSRFPVALEKYDVKRLSGRFAEVVHGSEGGQAQGVAGVGPCYPAQRTWTRTTPGAPRSGRRCAPGDGEPPHAWCPSVRGGAHHPRHNEVATVVAQTGAACRVCSRHSGIRRVRQFPALTRIPSHAYWPVLSDSSAQTLDRAE